MTSRHLALIRFVSSRYVELQGLYMVLSAGWVALWLSLGSLLPPPGLFARDALTSVTAVALICLLPGFAGAYLRYYYASRWGRLGGAPSVYWDRMAAMILGVAFAAAAPGDIDFTAVSLGFALMHLWITVRDRPFRQFHLLGSAGCLVSTVLTWNDVGRGADLAGLQLFLTSIAAMGLLDHLLLVRTMRRRRPEMADAPGSP